MSLPPLPLLASLPNITTVAATAASAHFFDLRLTHISQLMPPEIWAISASDVTGWATITFCDTFTQFLVKEQNS